MNVAGLHTRFQFALLQLIRRQNAARQLDVLAKTARVLSLAPFSEQTRVYWRIVERVVAVGGTGAEPETRKRLLACLRQAERDLGRLAREGDGFFSEAPAGRVRGQMEAFLSVLERDKTADAAQSLDQSTPNDSIAETQASDPEEPDLDDAAAAETANDKPLSSPEMEALQSTMAKMAAHDAWGALGDTTPPSTEAESGEVTESVLQVEPSDCAPIEHVLPRLKWVVRQGCRDLNRICEIELVDSGTVPRTMLKALVPILETLTRNAVYLGAVAPPAAPTPQPPPASEKEVDEPLSEAPAPRPSRLMLGYGEREARGVLALETETLALDLTELSDVAQAVLPGPDPLTPSGLAELLLNPDFSPADRARQVAGYGSGLAEAADTVRSMGGALAVEPGGEDGLRFVLTLPPWRLVEAELEASESG